MAAITLKVNGRVHELDVDPSTPLLYILRNDLGLKGAKFGCGLEQCGACAVLVGAESLLSCGLPVGHVGDRDVTTIEGLGTEDRLHPLQQAFIDERAVQCGYCTPGLIVAATALLAWNAEPTEGDIRQALRDQLCRCGTHDRVIRAVKRAATEMSG
jgi:nicotinate dehydrogenase subunit A